MMPRRKGKGQGGRWFQKNKIQKADLRTFYGHSLREQFYPLQLDSHTSDLECSHHEILLPGGIKREGDEMLMGCFLIEGDVNADLC